MISSTKPNAYFDLALIVSVGFIILFIPTVVDTGLMDGIQTGKSFFFGYSVIIMLGIFSIKQLFKDNNTFRLTIIDILLVFFILWISFNKFYLHDLHCLSIRYFELLFLAVFYLIIRNIPLKYYSYLLSAVCIGGIIQAVYGNMQLWGIYPSYHSLFKMTGSFFNPGPYAGYLCGILPIAVGLLWMVNGKEQKINTKNIFAHFLNYLRINNSNQDNLSNKQIEQYFIRLIAIITIVIIAIVLPSTRSRAAWLGGVFGIIYLVWYKFHIKNKVNRFINLGGNPSNIFGLGKRTRLALLITIIATLIFSFTFVLYHFKKDSADGRLLIWKATVNMIKVHPVLGVGQGMFTANYMDYQANYLRNHPNSKFETVAGDNQYAFNEFLNIWVENGVIGLALFTFLLLAVFYSNNNHININALRKNNDFPNNLKKSRLQNDQLFSPIKNQTLKLSDILRASILSILVFGCFSYAFEILPIKLVAIVCLSMLSGLLNNRKHEEQNIERLTKSVNLVPFLKTLWRTLSMRIIFPLVTIILIALIFPEMITLKNAYTSWNKAFSLYSIKHYNECLKEYENGWPILKNNGDYLLNYGKALSQTGEQEKSLKILERSSLYMKNTLTYTALGDCYYLLDRYCEAEESYQIALDMAPSRFYAEYLLAKLYNTTGEKEKAKQLAQKILQKDIKVKSTAIGEIKIEMLKILTGVELKPNTNLTKIDESD